LSSDPNGQVAPLPPSTPVYAPGHAGDPEYLINGILISGGEVRVAIQNPIGYTFGRAVGLGSNTIGAQARAKWRGNLLPIAVPRYENAPGPNLGVSYPCSLDLTKFLDNFATESTGCLGDEVDAALRTLPSMGAPFNSTTPDDDPANHGPIIPILGQGAAPANGADFRGFVALDIRNFAATGTQVYFNQVTAGTQRNTLKSMEAQYIYDRGYPGPDFPTAVSPPDPNDQVATMSGNDTGVAIDAMNDRYKPGDQILVSIYPGSVMAIPDFAMSPPSVIAVPSTVIVVNGGTMKVSRNQSFAGTVTLTTASDTYDPNNPMNLGTLVGPEPVTYTPNAVTPSLGNGTSVLMQNLTTVGATPGIYTLWVRGEAGSPYLTVKYVPFALWVGSVTRDFSIISDTSTANAANPGDNLSFQLTLANSPSKNTSFGGPVTLSVDPVLPAGVGAISFGSSTVTPTKTGASTTLTINTGTMIPGVYRLVVRATGMNGDPVPSKVTHLLPLEVQVATGGGSHNDYVDITGFAVVRIAEINSNYVSAYAVTPAYPDMNDPHLRQGQIARLVPWID